jgi:hypothetical protein
LGRVWLHLSKGGKEIFSSVKKIGKKKKIEIDVEVKEKGI